LQSRIEAKLVRLSAFEIGCGRKNEDLVRITRAGDPDPRLGGDGFAGRSGRCRLDQMDAGGQTRKFDAQGSVGGNVDVPGLDGQLTAVRQKRR